MGKRRNVDGLSRAPIIFSLMICGIGIAHNKTRWCAAGKLSPKNETKSNFKTTATLLFLKGIIWQEPKNRPGRLSYDYLVYHIYIYYIHTICWIAA